MISACDYPAHRVVRDASDPPGECLARSIGSHMDVSQMADMTRRHRAATRLTAAANPPLSATGVDAAVGGHTLCGGMIADTRPPEFSTVRPADYNQSTTCAQLRPICRKVLVKCHCSGVSAGRGLDGLTSRMVPDHESLTEAPFTT